VWHIDGLDIKWWFAWYRQFKGVLKIVESGEPMYRKKMTPAPLRRLCVKLHYDRDAEQLFLEWQDCVILATLATWILCCRCWGISRVSRCNGDSYKTYFLHLEHVLFTQYMLLPNQTYIQCRLYSNVIVTHAYLPYILVYKSQNLRPNLDQKVGRATYVRVMHDSPGETGFHFLLPLWLLTGQLRGQLRRHTHN